MIEKEKELASYPSAGAGREVSGHAPAGASYRKLLRCLHTSSGCQSVLKWENKKCSHFA